MRIGICDAIQGYRDTLRSCVAYYFSMRELPCEIEMYSGGQALLEANLYFDILFLDIELQDGNGFDVAKQIQAQHKRTVIVLVTSYHKYLGVAMDMNTLRFLDKPITQARIEEVLTRAIEEIDNGYLSVHTIDNTIHRLKKSELVFAEVVKKTTTFYTREQVLVCREPIARFRDALSASYFAVPHNSYIVNLNYVHTYQRDKLIMDYGNPPQVIYIATRRQSEFRHRFINFIGEKY